jgi:hypothetical protein
VCNGLQQIRNQNVWNTLHLDSQNRKQTSISNTLFTNTWVGIVKSAVVWYRDTRSGSDGPLYLVTGRESDFMKLMRQDGSFTKRLALPKEAGEGTDSTSTVYSNSTIPSNTTTPDVEPGQGVTTIRDSTGALQLYPAYNGNLFLSAVSAATPEDLALLTNGTTLNAMTLAGNKTTPYVINGDSTERLLHSFPDKATTLSASRLRLAAWDKLPVGSRLINLVPIVPESGDVTKPVLVAFGSEGEYLWPVMCAIEG